MNRAYVTLLPLLVPRTSTISQRRDVDTGRKRHSTRVLTDATALDATIITHLL